MPLTGGLIDDDGGTDAALAYVYELLWGVLGGGAGFVARKGVVDCTVRGMSRPGIGTGVSVMVFGLVGVLGVAVRMAAFSSCLRRSDMDCQPWFFALIVTLLVNPPVSPKPAL